MELLMCSECNRVLPVTYDGLACPDCDAPLVVVRLAEIKERMPEEVMYAS